MDETFLLYSTQGWMDEMRRVSSPNCDARPEEEEPTLIVVHAISLPPDRFGGVGVEQLFTNTLNPDEHPYYASIATLRVSAHFFVRRDGEMVQFVSTGMRAWHAGNSSWKGRSRCNDFSIGIELEGCDTLPFEDVQYERLAQLIGVLRQRYPTIVDVAGHADIAPGRKTDPGPFFDWSRLGAMPELVGLHVAALSRQADKAAIHTATANQKPDKKA